MRGLAYSRMRRHNEAAAEFQKFLDHPGIVLNDPMGPMARLQLARALSASGDREKSAAVCKDLLALWKDADPDIPVVQEVKGESAKQQRERAETKPTSVTTAIHQTTPSLSHRTARHARTSGEALGSALACGLRRKSLSSFWLLRRT
jgi:hypothetical protein